MNPEQTIKSFLEFEERYAMFKVKVDGVYIWHYIRFYLYNELLNLYGLPRLEGDSTGKKKQKEHWSDYLKELIVYNQFLVHQRDVLIIPHPRKYNEESIYYKCIYTDLLDNYLSNSHYILDGKSREGVFACQRSHNVLHMDLEAFKKMKRLKCEYRIASSKEVNTKIIVPLEKYFNVEFSFAFKKRLFELINFDLNERVYLEKYYSYMLKKIKPKIILMVVSYGFDRMVLCEIAKRRGIPVVELQHGTINFLHIAYNFHEKMNLPSFPDYIFSFGKYEKYNAKFPIGDERIIPTGYPELENKYHSYKKSRSSSKRILFISQGIKESAICANILAENLDTEKYHIIYKLHPKEYFDWKKNIGKYLHNPNIEVAGDFGHTIYDFLAEADWVVGNSSTVLYEAQMFDVKVAVLKNNIYDKSLCEYGNAVLVDSPEKLMEEIKKDTFQPNKKISFFEKNSLEKMQTNINNIIKRHQKANRNVNVRECF